MISLRFARDFIFHLLKAKTRHGTHSPFVYQLVDEVIYDTKPTIDYPTIQLLRKQMLADDRLRKSVSVGFKSLKQAHLLYRLAIRFNPANILLAGDGIGDTALYFQKAAPKSRICILEKDADTSTILQQFYESAGAKNMDLIAGNYDDTLPAVIDKLQKLDFIVLGSGISKHQFDLFLPMVHEDTIMIIDNIYRNEISKQAWAEIKANSQVTATVDLFWMGLVFFRKGQRKEDFWIRF